MCLQEKIIQEFEGKVVRKDLTKLVRGNAVVPSYVLEYLLGQHCASFDEVIIEQGVEKVKGIIRNHFVHRDEAQIIKSTIKEKGQHRIIDKVAVRLNDKKGVYEADFANLGIKNVLVSSETIKRHQKLLTSGVWCIVNLSYFYSEDPKSSPWIIESLKPIQISNVNLEEYIQARKNFSREEWTDLLMQSIGLNPREFNFRSKLIQLSRLIPYCENNFNYMELGPKGTGKSHIFSEMSPHGILISGGDVTQAKLFVNNSNGEIGLVGYWDTVAFDEFAGSEKRVDKKLVDIMKNYMANKSFSRGSHVYGASASFSFIGNTSHSVQYMLKHSNLFEALPKGYYDTAFLDRVHLYIPGWEVQKLRNELFTNEYGFIVDYLAEILKELRKDDFSLFYKNYFTLSESITTRDRDGVLKTFSGLMKIIYPDGKATPEEVKELLDFALEGRRRVKEQLVRMDETFGSVDFSYVENKTDKEIRIQTLEEKQYANLLSTAQTNNDQSLYRVLEKEEEPSPSQILKSGVNKVYEENTKGISYQKLFGEYLKGASEIILADPYIRQFYQFKNLMEFIELLIKLKLEGDDITLKVFTKYDEIRKEEAKNRFEQIIDGVDGSGIVLEYDFDQNENFHARSIETDTGWKISLDRGLDIFQSYDSKNPFNLANHIQEERMCKRFEISYFKN